MKTVLMTKNLVLIVLWVDKKCVTIRTSYDKVELTYTAQRWDMGAKEKISVLQPRVLNTYSRSM